MTHSVERVRWRRGDPAAQAASLLARGLGQVTRTDSLVWVEARCAGNCTAPYIMRWCGDERPAVFVTDIHVRCRKCRACLRQRKREWVARSLREFALLGDRRTWFFTGTVQPEWRYRHIAAARVAFGGHFERLSPEKKATLALAELGKTVTVWFKRFRQRSVRRAGAEGRPVPVVRYVCAFEQHEDGEWHVHALVHEMQGQVREEDFRATWWPVGFAQAKLVTEPVRAAFYVAKYLAYEGPMRLRASLHYGQGGPAKPVRRGD